MEDVNQVNSKLEGIKWLKHSLVGRVNPCQTTATEEINQLNPLPIKESHATLLYADFKTITGGEEITTPRPLLQEMTNRLRHSTTTEGD